MNWRLGEMGGRRVVDLEKHRLVAAGRDDLTGKLEWVSNTRGGDGLGHDIVSFGHECEDELHLEVKATTLGRHFPFMVSANEVRVSAREPDASRNAKSIWRTGDSNSTFAVIVVGSGGGTRTPSTVAGASCGFSRGASARSAKKLG